MSNRSIRTKRAHPMLSVTLVLALSFSTLAGCGALGGAGNLLGGLTGGIPGPVGAAYTLISLIPPPRNVIEQEYNAPLTPAVEGKFLNTEPLPVTINPEIVAKLPAVPAHAALNADGKIYYTEEDTGIVRQFDPATNAISPDAVIDLHVNTSGDRGLKGIAFSTDGSTMFLTYDRSATEADSEGDANAFDSRLVSYPFAGGKAGEAETIIYSTAAFDKTFPTSLNGIGPCMVAPDGFLYMAHGDRDSRFSALDLASSNGSGKIFRWNQDGTIPAENPIPDNAVFASGFRRPTSFAVNPKNGLFWVADVGSTVSDELNLLTGGRFYGWPIIHGSSDQEFENDVSTLLFLVYQGPIVDFGFERIAPRGLAILDGAVYGDAVDGDIMIGQSNVVPAQLHRFSIDEGLVANRTFFFTFAEAAGRIVEMVTGPDGRVYVFCQNELFVLNPG